MVAVLVRAVLDASGLESQARGPRARHRALRIEDAKHFLMTERVDAVASWVSVSGAWLRELLVKNTSWAKDWTRPVAFYPPTHDAEYT